mgnify:CR=1 FL=1
MKKLTLLIVILCIGCGPSKRDVATSRINQIAHEWTGNLNFKVEENDPWGNAYQSKIEKGSMNYVLEIRSSGPDGLPFTRDDLVAQSFSNHSDFSKVLGKDAENIAEGTMKGIGRGITEGIREGMDKKEKKESKK